jgi:hypothetical protein
MTDSKGKRKTCSRTVNGYKLHSLNISNTLVTSVAPLVGQKIRQLHVMSVNITDMHLLDTSSLLDLWMSRDVADLTFLRGSTLSMLANLNGDQVARNVSLLKNLATVKTINNKPSAEFWKEWDAKNGFPPLPAGWVERVKALPEAEQLAEIKAEIIKRNPGFEKDGEFETVDTWLRISHTKLKDITPLAALTCRKDLKLNPRMAMPISDLENISALESVNLSRLDLSRTKVVDLTPLARHQLIQFSAMTTDLRDISLLAKMPIRALYVNPSKIGDLSALKEMPLVDLMHNGEAVSSLEPLRGKKMERIHVNVSADCNDLSPLRGMPLNELTIDAKLLKANLPIMETLRPTLKTINGKPAEEFWKSVGR